MHHGTCVTHVPRCMPGLLIFEVGGGKNVPGIIGACATCNVTYLARGPYHNCWCPGFLVARFYTITVLFTYNNEVFIFSEEGFQRMHHHSGEKQHRMQINFWIPKMQSAPQGLSWQFTVMTVWSIPPCLSIFALLVCALGYHVTNNMAAKAQLVLANVGNQCAIVCTALPYQTHCRYLAAQMS